MFYPYKQTTLLIISGRVENPEQKHLFIILTNPFNDDAGGKPVLMVPISSVKPGIPFDSACILNPGDHKFVTQQSFVLYALTRLEDANKLIRAVKDGKMIVHNQVKLDVFSRICDGLNKTTNIPPKFLTFYRKAS